MQVTYFSGCLPSALNFATIRFLYSVMRKVMDCRLGCGACCIAPSISTPIPGMPDGKPAGVRCVQLNEENLCRLFGKEERPKVCLSFKPCADICGDSNEGALTTLLELEAVTKEN